MNLSSIWLALRTWIRFRRNTDREARIAAWAIALVLHAAAILALVRFPAVAQTSVTLPPPVQVRLLSESAPSSRTSQPHYFTEQPPDRADKTSEKPEFLSNVTSRAKDLATKGADALPQLKGDADAPMVKLDTGGRPSPAQAAKKPQVSPSAEDQPKEGSKEKQQAEMAALGLSSQKHEFSRAANSAPLEGRNGSGNADIPQPEMDNPNGRADLTGDVTLSTTAWNYAPWLQRFGRKVMDLWVAPTAYRIGLLKDGGWTVVEMRISRSGELLVFQPLENRGHSSLIIAAQSALRNTAPEEALPSDFPDSTLVLRVRMIYPRVPSR